MTRRSFLMALVQPVPVRFRVAEGTVTATEAEREAGQYAIGPWAMLSLHPKGVGRDRLNDFVGKRVALEVHEESL